MQKLVFVEGDTAPRATFELLTGVDATVPVDLSGSSTSAELILAGSGVSPSRLISMELGANPELGEVVYDPALGGTEQAGDFAASIRVTFSDGSVQTVLTPILIQVLPSM